jgi:hypothetical protein
MMLLLSGTATIIHSDVIFESSPAAVSESYLFSVDLYSIVNAVFIYRFFLRPKKPRWQFSLSAGAMGDVLMFCKCDLPRFYGTA